jgi:hypothetical protein
MIFTLSVVMLSVTISAFVQGHYAEFCNSIFYALYGYAKCRLC